MNGLNHVSAGTLSIIVLFNKTISSLRKEDKFLFPEVKAYIEQYFVEGGKKAMTLYSS